MPIKNELDNVPKYGEIRNLEEDDIPLPVYPPQQQQHETLPDRQYESQMEENLPPIDFSTSYGAGMDNMDKGLPPPPPTVSKSTRYLAHMVNTGKYKHLSVKGGEHNDGLGIKFCIDDEEGLVELNSLFSDYGKDVTLKRLSLCGVQQKISSEKWKLIRWLFFELEEFTITSFMIDSESVSILVDALCRLAGHTMKKIDFWSNDLQEDDCIAIVTKVLSSMKCIKFVNVGDNLLTGRSKRMLRDLNQQNPDIHIEYW